MIYGARKEIEPYVRTLMSLEEPFFLFIQRCVTTHDLIKHIITYAEKYIYITGNLCPALQSPTLYIWLCTSLLSV
jgi:hypothetical protein